MNIKTFIGLFLFAGALMFADAGQEIPSNETQSFTFCIKENQKIDTSNWIRFPIAFGYINGEFSKEEKIEISFPTEPNFIEERGLQSSYITANDEEGMTFNISSMQIPEDDFNLRKSVDFLAESITKSSTKKLIAIAYPDPIDSNFGIMWVENNKMTKLTLIKSAHFVYFLETSVRNEIYRDVEANEMGTASFDNMIRDSLKTGAFIQSLVILE